MGTEALKERFGDDVFEQCSQDDVESFKKWVDARKLNDYSGLLQVAAFSDSGKIAGYCLAQGAKSNALVMSAVAYHQAAQVHRKLIESGAVSIDYYIEWQGPILSFAVKANDLSWVEFCLDHGADPNRSRVEDHKLVLAVAAGNDNLKLVQLLLARKASKLNSGALINAAEVGAQDMVCFLLQEGFDVDEIGIEMPTDPDTLEDVGTALHKAIEKDNAKIVDLLLAAKASLTLRDGKGRTALELAEELGRAQLVEKLKAAK